MTNLSFFSVTIFKLEIVFNFSVQVLRFTQTNNQTKKKKKKKKKTVYNPKLTLLKGPNIYVLHFIFREISPKFAKSLKLQLN